MSLRAIPNCSILYSSQEPKRWAGQVRDSGFSAMEMWWPFPTATPLDAEVEELTHSIIEAGVQLAACNLYAGDMASGDRGVANLPSEQNRFRDATEIAARIGELTGCRKFNMLLGRAPATVAAEVAESCLTESLVYAHDVLSGIGGTILIEPLSGVEDYPLKTILQCADFVSRYRSSGLTNLSVLADLFHSSNNGEDVSTALLEAGPLVGHVQIADSPGRHEPGTGTLPLRTWIEQLESQGYIGDVGLEYVASMWVDGVPDLGWMNSVTEVLRKGAES